MRKIITLIISIFLLSTFSGCRTLTYESKDGAKIHYSTFMLDSETEGLEVDTPDGRRVKVTKNTSNANAALDVVNNIASKIPTPVGGTITNNRNTIVRPSTRPSQ